MSAGLSREVSNSTVSTTEGSYYINKKHVEFVEEAIKVQPEGGKKDATVSHLPKLPMTSTDTATSSKWYDVIMKKKELTEVEKELSRTREEFSLKMADIMKRKMEFHTTWKKVQNRIDSLTPYINDIDKKTQKTKEKERIENLEIAEKEKILKSLHEELKAANDKNMKLLTRIDNYKKFADYLTAVGEIGFEELMVDCVSPCQAVIKRHQTLLSIKEDILKNISTTMNQLDEQQRENEQLYHKHTETLSHLTAKASQLERKLEYLTNRNSKLEDTVLRNKQMYNSKICQTQTALQAIDNMARMCCEHKRRLPTTFEAKLKLIKTTILEKQEIIKEIKSSMK